MHSPPSYLEKLGYINQDKLWLYLLGILSALSLLVGMGFFSLSHPELHLYLPFVFLIGFYLSLSYFIGIFSPTFNYLNHIDIGIRGGRISKEYSVDVYLPCAGEPLDVLENTYKHVALILWPLIQVYVLDDKGDTAVMGLANKFGFHYITRPNRGELKKAGNLRYAFPRTKGELILLLDADFAPRSDILKELVPYFENDPKIAIVQTPQFFEIEKNHPYIQKGAAYIQELFYRLIQVNRNQWGASVCVGTNAIYRRKALEPFGGTAPIPYSEDVHTGFMLIKAGWKIEYVPINLAKGICPTNLYSFFVQQYRWAMGSVNLFLSKDFWHAKISIMARLCYLSGMLYYIATGLGIFLTPIPSLIVVWFYPEMIHWYNLIFSIPSLVYGTICLALWSKAPFGIYALTTRQVSYWAYLFAVVDRLRGNLIPWVPTGATENRVFRYKIFWGLFTTWSIGVFGAQIVGCIHQMTHYLDYNFYPTILLSTFNYFLFMKTLVEE